MKNKILTLTILLFCFGNLILVLKKADFHLLSFDQPGKTSEVVFNEGMPLLAGDKVVIDTTSNYNNLGNILVRFTNNYRDSNDKINFSLYDQKSNSLVYKATYNTDQFLPDRLFPFGFQPISDSKNKSFRVIIESTRGSTESGIYISANSPIFVFRSVLPKAEFFQNPTQVVGIIVSKLKFIFSSPQLIRSSLLSFTPLVLYLLFLSFKKSSYSYQFCIFLLFSGLFLTLKKTEIDYQLVCLSLYWLLFALYKKIPSLSSLVISLSFFVFASILATFGYEIQADTYFSISLLIFLLFLLLHNIPKQTNNFKSLKEFYVNLNNFDREAGLTSSNILIFISKTIYYFLLIKTIFRSIEQFFFMHDRLISFPRNFEKETIVYLAFVFILLLGIALVTFIVKKVYGQALFYPVLYGTVFLYASINSQLYSYGVSHTLTPHITAINPNLTSEAWVDVTINGKNFQDLPFVGKVTLAGEVQEENVHFWSNEKIVFRTNPSNTKTGVVCVQTLSKGDSNCLPFEYHFNQKQ